MTRAARILMATVGGAMIVMAFWAIDNTPIDQPIWGFSFLACLGAVLIASAFIVP